MNSSSLATALAVLALLAGSPGAPAARPAGPAGGPTGDGLPADDAAILRGEVAAACDAHATRLVPFGWSGQLGVMIDGDVVLARGYGLADRETGRPMRADTVSTIGSITKQFTGACILRLQDDGALSVDDPISHYFEDVPADKRGITIHHLLTHGAGFPGAIGDDFSSPTREAFLRDALATGLLFPPGTGYAYSNVGFTLAAIIVELVSGRDYETFLREELLLPAGMEKTGYHQPGFAPDEMAVGSRRGERWGTFLERPSFTGGPSWHLKGNGGVQSTVLDMLAWHRATAGGLLSAEARAAWKGRHVDEGYGDSWYGYGWVTFVSPGGGDLVAHNGGNGVFSADFRHDVDRDVVVYGTSSTSDVVADHVVDAVLRIALGFPVERPPAVVVLDPAALDALTGAYRLGGDDTVTVTRHDGGLRLVAGGPRAASLVAGGDGRPLDEAAERLARRSVEAVSAWIDGDARGLHAAFGGRHTLADIESSLADFRRMREDAYGPLEGARVAAIGREGPQLRVTLAMQHARGPAYLVLGWEDGQLVLIDLVRAPPATEVDVQPVAPGTFVSYRPGRPAAVEVTFDDATGALAFATGAGEVRLRR